METRPLKVRISVAICTYNGEKYLSEQLDSILHQSLMPDEIVLCDDQSTDGTLRIAEKYKDDFKGKVEIILIQNPIRLGVARNFEKAIQLTTGDYIFLSDQDDVWKKNKTEVLMHLLRENPSKDVIFSDAELMGAQQGTLWNLVRFGSRQQDDWKRQGALYAILRYKSICTGASMALKKEAKKYVLPFVENPYQIHDGWIAIAAAVRDRIFYSSEKLYFYRIHENQWTVTNTGKTDPALKEDIRLKCNFIAYFQQYYHLKDAKIEEMHRHYLKRQNVSLNPVKRASEIIGEALKGNYFRYSNGLRSIVRDLFS